jgi:hypothetical protein
MNVSLHHRSVHAQLLAVFQTQLDGMPDYGLINGLHRGRGEPVEGVVLGYAVAIEIGKRAQGETVIDAFAQLAIIPVLDAHENERAQGLRGSYAIAAGVGVLQAPHQILAHLLDQGGMVIQESQDALQEGVEVDTLMAQFEIGKAELRWGEAVHTFFSGRSSCWFNSQIRSKVTLSWR